MLTGPQNNKYMSDSNYNNMAWQWTSLVSDKFYIQLNPIINIIMATLAHDDRRHIRNNYFILREFPNTFNYIDVSMSVLEYK